MLCLVCQQEIKETPMHGMHAACFCAEFKVEPQTDFSDIFEAPSVQEKTTEQPVFKRFNSSFFHGRYRKYSGTLGKNNYIMKVEQPEFPELPAVEYISNQIAKVWGLPLPEFHFIKYNNNSFAFLSRNLMDTNAPATLDHIYKFLKEDSVFDCKTLAQIVQVETGRLGDVHRFVEICLFDSIIGNHDRHGRNLAFITKSGGRTLSAFYDNPSYLGIADPLLLDADIQPRGTIQAGACTEPVVKDYVQEFEKLGLSSATDRFKQRILSKVPAAIELIENTKILSPRRKVAFVKLIEKRIQDLQNG
jgi:serine/threonine-protein kinase HipA